MKTRYSLLSQDDFDLTDGAGAEETGSLLGGLSDMWGGGDSGSSVKKTAASHDRPEKSVTLRLYTMQKHQFLLAFVVFFALFFVSVILGVVSPDMVKRTEVRASDVVTNASTNIAMPAGPFVIKSPRLNRYNQQL